MTPEEILQQYELKGTGCRKYILGELVKSHKALSEQEIKAGFPDLFDRVTFYRTLRTLEDSGAIHKIVLNDNTVKYAVSDSASDTDNGDHTHAHFHCTVCNQVLCLHEGTKVQTSLPKGFAAQNIYVVIDGLCATCK